MSLNSITNSKIQSHKINRWFNAKGCNLFNYQVKTALEVFKDKDILVTSPTGSGKTIAGILPTIIDSKNFLKNTLYTLYISPLKSLSYDIERNLLKPINELNLNISISVRTGDTSSYKKSLLLKKPPNILVTTPESFALLMSYQNVEGYFKNLKYLIIDELHSLIHTKRGDLFSLNLARLNIFAPKHNKIALSGTITNLKNALKYISNKKKTKIIKNNTRKKLLVSIIKTKKKTPWSGFYPTYAINEIYNKILKNKSTIIFVNTRAQSEYLFQSLWKVNSKNINIAIHHGSIEKKLRIEVEKKMYNGELRCVVATSSLELGIDWGNVSLIIHIGAPKGVSRIMQRIGRSNHKIDLPSKAILVPTNKFEYLECEAAKNAIEQKDIEDIKDKDGSLDVLAQHIFGVACSRPFNKRDLYENIRLAYPYKNLNFKTYNKIVNFVENGGYSLKNYKEFTRIKINTDGLYMVSDKKLIHKYRMNIGTIIDSELINIYLKNKKLGKIEDYFIQNLVKGDTFLFAGQVLEYLETNMKGVIAKKCYSKYPKIPSFTGGRLPLSSKLSRRVINLLNHHKKHNLPAHIVFWLDKQRHFSMIPPKSGLLIETFAREKKYFKKNYLVAYTFQGRAANQTLGIVILEKMLTLKLEPIAFVANDYALVIWSGKECKNVKLLFHEKYFFKGFERWLDNTSLIRKHFKTVAIISGLIDKNYPGYIKTNKQIRFNSDLIFDVLKKYEKNHILLKSTRLEALDELLEYDKINNYLNNIKSKIIHKKLNKVSPLSIPLLLEFNKEKIRDKILINKLEHDNTSMIKAEIN